MVSLFLLLAINSLTLDKPFDSCNEFPHWKCFNMRILRHEFSSFRLHVGLAKIISSNAKAPETFSSKDSKN